MANKEKDVKAEEKQEVKSQAQQLAEAKAYRASLAKNSSVEKTEEQKREEFRLFWAQEKAKYGKTKELEEILWVHLKAIKMDSPDKFEAGIKHFGLKKLGN